MTIYYRKGQELPHAQVLSELLTFRVSDGHGTWQELLPDTASAISEAEVNSDMRALIHNAIGVYIGTPRDIICYNARSAKAQKRVNTFEGKANV